MGATHGKTSRNGTECKQRQAQQKSAACGINAFIYKRLCRKKAVAIFRIKYGEYLGHSALGRKGLSWLVRHQQGVFVAGLAACTGSSTLTLPPGYREKIAAVMPARKHVDGQQVFKQLF